MRTKLYLILIAFAVLTSCNRSQQEDVENEAVNTEVIDRAKKQAKKTERTLDSVTSGLDFEKMDHRLRETKSLLDSIERVKAVIRGDEEH